MGHTPGPWAVYPPEMLDNKHWSVQTDCGMTIVCGEDTPEAAADAHLIAAAPELLTVCQAMAGDLQALLDGDDFSGMSDAEMFGVMLRSLNAAIAKAEGRSE